MANRSMSRWEGAAGLALVTAAFALPWMVPDAGAQTPAPAQLRQAVRDVERERVAAEAIRAVSRYMETWNTRDSAVWARSLHFPHVRPGVGQFRLTRTPDEYARGVSFERTVATGWHRSQWDSFDVIQAGPDKAHVAGHYSRFDAAGEQIRSTLITYVVTRQGDRWGVQSRFAAGAADVPADRRAELGAAAVAAVERYVAAFNDPVDAPGWAATLNYPHVRVADGAVDLWDSADAYLQGPQVGRQRTWSRTRLDGARPVQIGAAGVNVAVRLSRLNRLGVTLSSHEAVYLVTNRDGNIGIQARSSFAP